MPGDVNRAADASQLYPSINHNYGIPATKHILDSLAAKNLLKAEDARFIVDLLAWILNNSYVHWNRKSINKQHDANIANKQGEVALWKRRTEEAKKLSNQRGH